MSKLSRKHKLKYKNRKRSLIKNKRGGGYYSSLSVNQDIDKVCMTDEFDNDRTLEFTITNIRDKSDKKKFRLTRKSNRNRYNKTKRTQDKS